MVDLKFFLFQLWEWFVNHGIPLTALLLCAILLPRLGRLAVRVIARRFSKGEEATKTRLALIGALVYVIQAIGFFIIIMLALTNLGVPPIGAALPATVLTAAIGFGSQKIIGDFLAGFFIISERQFGVGDFVSFDGTASDISGTVVALTLRATKVRTPSGELVTVPNGSAGVITNYSQEWSRAVVNLAIPLLPGEAMDDLISTVETTVHQALKDPSIVSDVRGQIEILPATEIIAPVAAGQPWSVNFRINAEVNPAMQWAVERVIRSALLNVFWDRYDLPGAPIGTGASRPPQVAGALSSSRSDADTAPTEAFPSPNRSAEGVTAPTSTWSRRTVDGHPAHTRDEEDSAAATKASPTAVFPALGVAGAAAVGNDAGAAHAANPEGNTRTTGVAGAAGAADGTDVAASQTAPVSARADGETGTKLIPENQSPADDDAEAAAPIAPSDHGPGKGLDADRFSEDDLQEFEPQRQEYDTRIKNILSLGGRVRWSTTALMIALLFVGLLAIFSSNPEGGNAGVLSPDKWRVTKTSEPTASETEPSPNQSEQPSSSVEETTTNTDDGNQAPTSQTNPPTDTDQGPNPGGAVTTNRSPGAPTAQRGTDPTVNPQSGNNPGTDSATDRGAGGANGASENAPDATR
ncbi:mechanosensitive ion channel domain-containing protein [Corynebacterium auriscanis]|uniref:mechanosensitive ion channel family protein n=1 Tax=Corynebacterium auriscanis TaxID=99807 RepID=UPI0024AE0FFC|nr:mechanosensitive ion channel family protein [Corynebacterium auriscanis]